MKNNRNGSVVLMVLIVVVVIAIAIAAYFLFLPGQCIYTARTISLPAFITGSKVLLEKNEYVAAGHDPDYGCVASLDTNDELVSNETINTVRTSYFTEQNRTVNTIASGTIFTPIAIIAATKHGIYTIDSGPGPVYFLILQDNNGVQYKVGIQELGFNDADAFLSYAANGQKQELSWDYFQNYLKAQ